MSTRGPWRVIRALTFALAAGMAGAGVVGVGAATADAPAGAGTARLGYQVYFGGLKALAFKTELDVSEAGYQARLEARTEGMIGWVFDYVARARSEGAVVDGGLRPARHVVESTARGNRRDTRLTFLPDGTIDSVAEPPPEADERDPVTAEQQRGAIDPLSAVLLAARTLARQGSCAQRLAVYDGRRRYDLEFSDGGREVLKPSEYASFAGEATLCLFRYIRVAGYQKAGSNRWSNPRDTERVYKVWLGAIAPGLPPLPVRIEAEGTFGSLIVHWVDPARPQG